ncbi:uncharacterized protein BDZ83DRAFT_605214 [Colletotrichum acutatum]|uniref:Uncharacterized protein n=1 Tax=Glomerella acutata TaxID=27357 RepID=A0AAD9CZQ6_GLOAC|nr:uncharacterized protein BDZ83DRAFT_605214 [Colletotrichum acutatum]KAK1729473.1 hypothetical protein BDZ83DRAFT_605214 [Colletotrichum acutatum]
MAHRRLGSRVRGCMYKNLTIAPSFSRTISKKNPMVHSETRWIEKQSITANTASRILPRWTRRRQNSPRKLGDTRPPLPHPEDQDATSPANQSPSLPKHYPSSASARNIPQQHWAK